MKSIILVLFLFCLVPIHGSCGLENCKDPSKLKNYKSIFSLELGARYTNFTYRDTDGYYEEFSLRGSYFGKNDWMLDFKIPAISFHYDGYETTGMSNPIFGGEKWFKTGNFSPLLGLQIEFPLGEDDKGITMNHFELLPYTGFGFHSKNYSFRLVAGYRFSLEGSGDSDATATVSDKKYHAGHVSVNESLTLAELGPHVVNYHAEEEAQLFISGGRDFSNNHFYVGFQGTVRQVIVGEDKLLLMYGGLAAQYNHQRFTLQSQINIPFSSDKKINWNIGLNLIFSF